MLLGALQFTLSVSLIVSSYSTRNLLGKGAAIPQLCDKHHGLIHQNTMKWLIGDTRSRSSTQMTSLIKMLPTQVWTQIQQNYIRSDREQLLDFYDFIQEVLSHGVPEKELKNIFDEAAKNEISLEHAIRTIAGKLHIELPEMFATYHWETDKTDVVIKHSRAKYVMAVKSSVDAELPVLGYGELTEQGLLLCVWKIHLVADDTDQNRLIIRLENTGIDNRANRYLRFHSNGKQIDVTGGTLSWSKIIVHHDQEQSDINKVRFESYQFPGHFLVVDDEWKIGVVGRDLAFNEYCYFGVYLVDRQVTLHQDALSIRSTSSSSSSTTKSAKPKGFIKLPTLFQPKSEAVLSYPIRQEAVLERGIHLTSHSQPIIGLDDIRVVDVFNPDRSDVIDTEQLLLNDHGAIALKHPELNKYVGIGSVNPKQIDIEADSISLYSVWKVIVINKQDSGKYCRLQNMKTTQHIRFFDHGHGIDADGGTKGWTELQVKYNDKSGKFVFKSAFWPGDYYLCIDHNQVTVSNEICEVTVIGKNAELLK